MNRHPFRNRRIRASTRLQVEGLEPRCLLATDTAWVGGATGNFFDATEWSDGAPTGDHNATISAPAQVGVQFTDSGTAENLTISEGSTVTASMGDKLLEIERQLVIGKPTEGASGLIVKDGEVVVAGLGPDLKPIEQAFFVQNGFVTVGDDDVTEPSKLKALRVAIGKEAATVTVDLRGTLEAESKLGVGYSGVGTLNVYAGGTLDSNIWTVVGGYNRADPFEAPDLLFFNPDAYGKLFVSGVDAVANVSHLFVGGNNRATAS